MYIKQTGFIDVLGGLWEKWVYSPFSDTFYDFIAAVLGLGYKLPIIIKAIYKFYYVLV